MMNIRIFLLLALAAGSTLFSTQKAVLFNDTSAWYHWGCTGTSVALKEQIQKLGFEIKPFSIADVYSLQEVPSFGDFDDLEKFERFQEANKEVLAAIRTADVVVITGEGTIHDLRAGPKALLYLAHISTKFLEKHVEIINHSAYPKDDLRLSNGELKFFATETEREQRELREAQAIYRAIYGQVDFIAIREPFSQEEMRKISIASTLSFDCLPLYIRDHYTTHKQVEVKTVVIAGSVAFTEPGALQVCRYMEAMAGRGFRMKVLIGAAGSPAKDDALFVEFLKTHCKAPWELVRAASMQEWLDTINQAAWIVSGRFHHSIAAFCLNTPFIALNSNTYKVHAICALLAQKEPLLYSDPKLLEHLISRTEGILSSPVVNNEAKAAEVCSLAERNFDGLKALSKALVSP